MKTLEMFKNEVGLAKLQFLKGTKANGCQWLDSPAGRVFLSPKTKTTDPMFVIVNDGKGNPKEGIQARPELAGTLWVVNANVTLGTVL